MSMFKFDSSKKRMTVKELIEQLQKLNPEFEIYIEDISTGFEYEISEVFSNSNSAWLEFSSEYE